MDSQRYVIRATGGGLYTVVDTAKSGRTMIPNTSKEKAALNCAAFNKREDSIKKAKDVRTKPYQDKSHDD